MAGFKSGTIVNYGTYNLVWRLLQGENRNSSNPRSGNLLNALPLAASVGLEMDSVNGQFYRCRFVSGRHSLHKQVNDVLCRAFISMGTLAAREQHSLCSTDNIGPESVTQMPWRRGGWHSVPRRGCCLSGAVAMTWLTFALKTHVTWLVVGFSCSNQLCIVYHTWPILKHA